MRLEGFGGRSAGADERRHAAGTLGEFKRARMRWEESRSSKECLKADGDAFL